MLTLEVPALRERREDILPLAMRFLGQERTSARVLPGGTQVWSSIDGRGTSALDTAALVDYIREQHELHLRAAIPFLPSLAARVAREYRARE